MFLRGEGLKTIRDSNMLDGSVNLITLEKWQNGKLKSMLNPLADIISNEEEKLKDIKNGTINTLKRIR